MSHVYVVVATRDSEIETCESFAGVQSALGRGFQLASDKSGRGRTDLFCPSPNEEVLPDGSLRWVFMDTNKQSVIVFYRKIEEALLSSKDPLSIISVRDPSSTSKPYDFANHSLPAGWKLNGQPATIGDLFAAPFDIKDPLWDLTDDQKWALVEARIRKSPNYRSPAVDSIGTRIHYSWALQEVKGRSNSGIKIRDAEIEALHLLREDLIASTDHS